MTILVDLMLAAFVLTSTFLLGTIAVKILKDMQKDSKDDSKKD